MASARGGGVFAGRQHDVLQQLSFWPLQIGGWTLYTIIPLGAWLVGSIQSPDYLWLALSRGVSGFVLTTALRPLCQRIFKAKIRPKVVKSQRTFRVWSYRIVYRIDDE